MIGRLMLLVCSVLATLFLLEIGCRLVRGPEALVDWRNIVLVQRLKMSAQNIGHRFAYDPGLGYVQRDGYSDPLMSFGEHGFRRMPPPPADATAGPPVLATGDSYTQGDEVDDDHTWPAQLQGCCAAARSTPASRPTASTRPCCAPSSSCPWSSRG